ncbi:Proline racemase [Lentibacillus halodurans]|uniref:Proline racemase n=1 Tax=Lentibacillus halodurans TaxID=237679 RepID=A0A1I0YRD8_9BACI|nr:proline racemase family protein [Lentibacillus halodurans]SFB14878.1 Proline racemase [Lentibacillus halodurans]
MDIGKMFTTIDTHVAGEAFRIVVQSPIVLNEKDILQNQALLQNRFQREKAFLLNEPRGHRGMNGCIVTPSDKADIAVLFFHHDSDIHFKYGGLVTTITALTETGNLVKNANNTYEVETIQGIYTIHISMDGNRVETVSFECDACHLQEQNEEYSLVKVDGLRNYYIYPLADVIPGLQLDHLASVKRYGKKLTQKLQASHREFSGVVLVEAVSDTTAHAVRSVTFERDGSIVRSPGMDSTFAIHADRLGRKTIGELTNHSIFNSQLTSKVILQSSNRFSMVAQGFVTGVKQFIYDIDDPLPDGFLLK